jgi:nicotinamide-nucleotide amidase
VTELVLTAEVVCVGDELLSGRVRDENAAWLGARLAEHGVPVRRATVVPDDVDAIAAAIGDAVARAGLVIVTGGLGGTSDDVTRAALARVSGGTVERDARLEQSLLARYAASSAAPPAGALAMADVVTGAEVLPNPVGVAPGLRLPIGNAVVVALPGVPSEVEAIATDSVLPALHTRRGQTYSLWLPRADEAAAGDALAPLEAALRGADVRVGYLVADGVVEVRFTGVASDGASLEALLQPVVARARHLLAAGVPGVVVLDEPPAAAVVHILTAHRATLAVAESLTGGAVAAALVEVPGASAVLRGSVVAYATDLKARLLGVPEPLLTAYGAVNPDVALAMAHGARQRLDAEWGVATTGVAGPTPQDGRPVGEVHVAVAGPGGEAMRTLALRGNRERIRSGARVAALVLLLEQLR